jgi:iron complex outermembrane receptor protein
MKTSILFAYGTLAISLLCGQPMVAQDSTKVYALNEIIVEGVRAAASTPISYKNLSKAEISPKNLGHDLPLLLNFLPSVVTTSDAGNGFGYTSIRVRGTDGTRVNVTINGVPFNDAESSMSYFVNMPDFASSVQNVQLQRGVGTSTNGSGAFGASLNMLTDNATPEAFASIANSVGSFNSRKHTVKFGTGWLNDRFEVSGRLSKLYSDGYIDRAFSDLKSYFLQGTYRYAGIMIKGLAFGGAEKTYQAWNGIDAEMLAKNRTYNYAGLYYDDWGNEQFYDNETDNYQQDHYQLHFSSRIIHNLNTHITFHYTKGKGFYENYKSDELASVYNLNPLNLIGYTDLIRQKWLDNDFYGAIFNLKYKNNFREGYLEATLSNAYNQYKGKHFGKVVWANYAYNNNLKANYYDYFGDKNEYNSFLKTTLKLYNKWLFFVDVQYRNINYQANGVLKGSIDKTYQFLNPKVGITFTESDKNELYLSYAKAQKEPNRTDFENQNPTPETLHDFEIGYRLSTYKIKINTNVYAMLYDNQLIKTGELDEVGSEIRKNIAKSYRLGVEVEAQWMPIKKLYFNPNITISSNKIKDYTVFSAGEFKNVGTTDISFSPTLIAGSELKFLAHKNLSCSLLSKYVGKQFAGNASDEKTALKAYFINDINLNYELKTDKIFKRIALNALINNVFNQKYVSNAYLYGDDYMSYFPQAGINFLVGLTLDF